MRPILPLLTAPRRLLPLVLLVPLAALAGCAALSSDYWHSPSVLTTAPPDPPKQGRREPQGGFSVLVDAPGQPTSARAMADISVFAQRRGFVREATQDGVARYLSGNVTLDVTFRASDSHVVASLHGAHLSRKFAESFYHDFDHQYAPQYGEENPILETDFDEDATVAPGSTNPGRERGGNGGRGR